jgi:CBS domain-containing protein
MADPAVEVVQPGARRLREAVAREIVACRRGATVQAAAAAMAAADTGSIVVLDEVEAPIGILTDSDLRRRVVAAGRPPETPVEAVMSGPLWTVPPETTFFEGVSLMLERGVHHLVLAEGGRAVGVVADSDLVAASSSGPLFLARRISRAASLEQLAAARAELPAMVAALIEAGVGGRDLTRITAETHDRLSRRALELAEAELGPPPRPYCWLGLGSQGRYEQTLHTDQDHALVYADPPAAEAERARRYFLALAEWVVAALEACGLPRCRGEAMASNPRWNLPLREWQARFSHWIERPEPDALLNASIFFDLRPLAGELSLGQRLQAQIAEQAPRGRLFLTLLANEARHHRPPLGLFGRPRLERSGEHRGALDLKHGGLMPVVDLARLFSLQRGIQETGTFERLRRVGEVGALPLELTGDLAAAYEFLLLLRVRSQLAQRAAGRPVDNYVEPRRLSRADRALLREHLALIAEAQGALAGEFPTYLLD